MVAYNWSFLHMDSSASLKEAAKSKISSVMNKFLSKAVQCDISFSLEGNESVIHCHVNGGDGRRYEAHARGENMFIALDKVTSKFEKQLRSQKSKNQKKGNFSIKAHQKRTEEDVEES